MKKYLFGDKNFYKTVLAVALPIIMQNAITNLVGFFDNVMVGRLGTEPMSGVSIVNQLVFIFILCVFGAVGGAGIYGAQFYGQGNNEGVRDTFRFKLILGFGIVVIATILLWFFQDGLISLYLHDGAEGDLAATLMYGKQYLAIVLIGLVPIAIEQSYSSTLRECGETVVPMVGSTVAVFVNLALNYVLIYGKLGFPEMGVVGAAIATNVSRYVQMLIVVIWSHTHLEKAPYFKGTYKNFSVKGDLIKKIMIMAAPLIVNETLWATGIAVQNQIYSYRGLSVVAALNINSAIYNLFNIVFLALGNVVGILVGQQLGAEKFDEAKTTAYRIIAFSCETSIFFGILLFFTAPLFPMIYNTSDEVRALATDIMQMAALLMPVAGMLHSTYFTIRSGGKTVITFLFDSVFLWVVAVPFGFVITKFTGLSIVTIYLLVGLADALKLTVGFFIMKSGIWVNNIVN